MITNRVGPVFGRIWSPVLTLCAAGSLVGSICIGFYIFINAYLSGTYATIVEVNVVGEFWPEIGMLATALLIGLLVFVDAYYRLPPKGYTARCVYCGGREP